MPKRTDIETILVIGAGPIVIGQGCEFDYSGTQAIKALKEEGYKVVLINSNPATIMTDPQFSDRTYIEPITVQYVEKIIQKEKPDAILPTVGGQTALNVAMDLDDRGIQEKYNVELIGDNKKAIETDWNELDMDFSDSDTINFGKFEIDIDRFKQGSKDGYVIDDDGVKRNIDKPTLKSILQSYRENWG